MLQQSFKDDFFVEGKYYKTPAAPGEVLIEGREGEYVDDKRMRRFRSGVGKLLYLAKWSRPDRQNVTRELSRFFYENDPSS